MQYRFKLLIAFAALAFVACALVFFVINHYAERANFRQIQATVLAIAVSTAESIDGDLHDELTGSEAADSDAYRRIESDLRRRRDAHREAGVDVAFIYTTRPARPGSDEWIYVIDAEEPGEDKSAYGDPFVYEAENPVDVITTLDIEPRADHAFTHDEYGSWLSGNAPVRNSTGKPVALLGVDLNAADVQDAARRLRNKGLLALLLALGTGVALATALSSWANRPLARITAALDKIGSGQLDTRIPVTDNDEFGAVERAVNTMADSLRQQAALQGSLTRFVSSEVADGMPTGHVTDEDSAIASSGSAESSSRLITVLFCDLHGLSRLSETLNPDQIAALLQTFFSKMITEVFEHGGTLDKSFETGFMATFGTLREDPDQQEHAVRAALAMARAGRTLGRAITDIGGMKIGVRIGIHSGPVSRAEMGIAQQRAVTAAGETVQIASRILEQSRVRDIEIIVSETVMDNVREDLAFDEAGELLVSRRGEQDIIQLFKVPSKSPGA